MKKIIILFVIALLSTFAFGQTAADLQNVSIGTKMTVECLSKKVASKAGKSARKDSYNSLDINVAVNNNQTKSASYDLEVFFLSKSMTSTKMEGDLVRDKQTRQILLDANAVTNVPFQAILKVGNEIFDCGWTGYIVRLSAFGKPIKTVASSKALEKLAADPVKMEQLAAGKIVAGKL
jgi:hypothetical protein